MKKQAVLILILAISYASDLLPPYEHSPFAEIPAAITQDQQDDLTYQDNDPLPGGTQTGGCTDPMACNYDPEADEDLDCIYPIPYYYDSDNDGFGWGDYVDYCQGEQPVGWVENDLDPEPDCPNPDPQALLIDDCGVCNGMNGDMDCAENCFGNAFDNECGCVGGNTGLEPDFCYGCTNPWDLYHYNPDATIDDGSCNYYGFTYLGIDDYDPQTSELSIKLINGCRITSIQFTLAGPEIEYIEALYADSWDNIVVLNDGNSITLTSPSGYSELFPKIIAIIMNIGVNWGDASVAELIDVVVLDADGLPHDVVVGGPLDLTQDCTGDPNGSAFENECGCVGGDTGIDPYFCYGCTNQNASNFNPDAQLNNGSCIYIDSFGHISLEVLCIDDENLNITYATPDWMTTWLQFELPNVSVLSVSDAGFPEMDNFIISHGDSGIITVFSPIQEWIGIHEFPDELLNIVIESDEGVDTQITNAAAVGPYGDPITVHTGDTCILDCLGTLGGDAFENECGCVGGNTGLEPDFCWGCTYMGDCRYDEDATLDDGSCRYYGFTYLGIDGYEPQTEELFIRLINGYSASSIQFTVAGPEIEFILDELPEGCGEWEISQVNNTMTITNTGQYGYPSYIPRSVGVILNIGVDWEDGSIAELVDVVINDLNGDPFEVIVGGPLDLAVDCSGETGGSAFENECGCVGGNTGLNPYFCYGCNHPDALNYDPDAVLVDGSCIFDSSPLSISLDVYEYDGSNGLLGIAYANDAMMPTWLQFQLSNVTVQAVNDIGNSTSMKYFIISLDETGTITIFSPINEDLGIEVAPIEFLSVEVEWEGELDTQIVNASTVSWCGQTLNVNIGDPLLQDCNGELEGEAFENECGCVGGNTGFEPNFCWGCTDPIALNHNPFAFIDDGSCVYENEITVEISNYDYSTGELAISTNSFNELSDFQFTLQGPSISYTSGGITEENDWTVLFDPVSGTITGDYSNGSVIPAYQGILLYIGVDWNGAETAVLSDVVFTGPGNVPIYINLGDPYILGPDCNGEIDGGAYENACGCVDGGTGVDPLFCFGCTDPDGDNYNPDAFIDDGSCIFPWTGASIEISFSDYNWQTGELEIYIVNPDLDIGGFQFNLTGVDVLGASGGLADDNDWLIQTNADGLVLSFSLNGDFIEPGNGVLVYVEIVCESDIVVGFDNVIFAHASSNEITTIVGGPFSILFEDCCNDPSVCNCWDSPCSSDPLALNFCMDCSLADDQPIYLDVDGPFFEDPLVINDNNIMSDSLYFNWSVNTNLITGYELHYSAGLDGNEVIVPLGMDTAYALSYLDLVESLWLYGQTETEVIWYVMVLINEESFSGSEYSLIIDNSSLSNDQQDIVTDFSLLQNYPNPFNPVTTISFNIPEHVPVFLEIYDMQGRSAAKLLDGDLLNIGHHSVVWNAEGFPSGVYFIRLQADSWILQRKMLLLQ